MLKDTSEQIFNKKILPNNPLREFKGQYDDNTIEKAYFMSVLCTAGLSEEDKMCMSIGFFEGKA
jgi:hypothetical protein